MARYVALWLLVYLAGRLPVRLLYTAAAAAGTIAWLGSRRLRAVTRDHMRHVLGPTASPHAVDAAARTCVRTAACYYADFARYPWLSPEALFAQVDAVEGAEILYDAFDRSEGLIVVSAHLGNPEILGQAAGPLRIGFAAITEPLQPPRVHEFVHRMRAKSGVRHLPANHAGLREALAHLKHGYTIGALVDRDVLHTGHPYAFFGERARMPTGAVEIARRTGAPVVAAWVFRTSAPGHYRLIFEAVPLPPATGDRAADLASGMRAVLASVERAVASAPGQWFPLSPVWSGLTADAAEGARPSR